MMDWIFLLAVPAYFLFDWFMWPASGMLSFMVFNAAYGIVLKTCLLATINILRMACIFAVIHITMGIPLTHPVLFVICVLDFYHGVHKAKERIDTTDEKEARSIYLFTRGVLLGQVAMAVIMAAVVWRAAML